ncbi:MAG TPA: hypothetical protein VE130_10575, partial [Nitrososphaeraceae archaeon]|nr:hypothetical protein [Nitrososphaeraceae archaeon]
HRSSRKSKGMTISQDEIRRNQRRVNRLRKKYRSQDKRVEKLHGVLKREVYDYPKKFDMVTFGQEIRNVNANSGYTPTTYLYKQKRENGIKTHKYVAKSLEVLHMKLRRQAMKEVYESDGDRYALDGLAPVEIDTFQFLKKECIRYKKKDRDYYAQRYIDQLRMRYSKTYRRIFIKSMPIPEKKNVLKAARKCFQRHEKIYRKIITMAKNAEIGTTIEDFIEFANFIIMKSGGHDTPKRLENYLIKRKKELESRNKYCFYSIFKESELGDVARQIIQIKKYRGYAFSDSDHAQLYHKTETRDNYTNSLSLK